jgi:hypothetical protein
VDTEEGRSVTMKSAHIRWMKGLGTVVMDGCGSVVGCGCVFVDTGP